MQSTDTSILYSVFSPQFISERVHQEFEIESRKTILLHHGFNDSYWIQALNGDFIFRVFKAGRRSEGEVLDETRLLAHLKSQGVATSPALSTKSGRPMIRLDSPEGVRYGLFFSKAAGGTPGSLNKDLCTKFGAALAQIHKAFDAYPHPVDRPDLLENSLIDQPLDALRRNFSQQHEGLEFLASEADKIRRKLEGLPNSSPHRGLIHGDFISVNSVVDTKGHLTIFDLDFSGVGYRLYDLASIKWQLRTAQPEQEDELFEHFKATYASQYHDFIDPHLLECFVWLRQLWVWAINVDQFHDFRRLNDYSFKNRLEILKKWAPSRLSETN